MNREYMQEVINGMRKIVKPYLAKQLKKINFEGCGNTDKAEFETDFEIVLTLAEQALAIPSAEPKTGQYEKHIDHTDCLWHGSGNCPVTCSQYRDGWNDAMDYIFKNGKGYQPYRHDD